jgi:tetratricopeptide (TPR) repeat protein
MTFENLQFGRVMRAVFITAIVGIILSFGTCYCFLLTELLPKINTNADIATQQKQLQDELQPLVEDIYARPPSTLNIMFLVQLGLVVLVGGWQSYWAAQVAQSARQAMGYAVGVTIGVLSTYGLLLLLFGPTLLVIKIVFYGVVAVVNVRAGQFAGQLIGKRGPAQFQAPGLRPPSGTSGPATPPGANPETYYNMGVIAALGGRREEARQHFTRVLQLQPRHVAAWLQLANLADTPEQAWNYVQQARSISPNDPAVIQAVQVIWPKVAANAARQGPSRLQPPYPGADQSGESGPSRPPPAASPPEAPAPDEVEPPELPAAEAPPSDQGDQGDGDGPPPPDPQS